MYVVCLAALLKEALDVSKTDENTYKSVSEAIKHTVDIELRVHNNVIDLNKLIGCSCSIDNIGDNVKKLVIYKMIDKKELRVK